MNNSIRFVPFSVKMRKAGFVRNPVQSWSIYSPKWIPAPPPSPVVDMTKVDRVVDVLSRFVATWVAQSRKARSEYRVREAGRKWRDAALSPNWADLSEAHERREAILARRQFEAWCAMPEDQWRAIARGMIADARDIGPLIYAVLKPVWEERDRRTALAAVAAAERQLHNRQRVVRPRNRFDTGSDSE
jgi:hypothetical protein